jgi:hypothetical protein
MTSLYAYEENVMPSVSAKQAKLMAAACHNPAIAKKRKISQKVACEFNKADAGGKFLKQKRKKK